MKIKKPRLVRDWKRVFWRSWANRLSLLAGVLGCLEYILPMFQDVIGRGPLAITALVLAFLVPIVRVISQPEFHEDDRG